MDNIILETPELKKAIFSLAENVNLSATIIIRNTIVHSCPKVANELLQLLYDNHYKDKSWYEIMDDIFPSSNDSISDEIYDLLEMWSDRVENQEERAKLSIKMLDFVD